MNRKPSYCSTCPYSSTGVGFVPDEGDPGRVKIAIVLEAPGQEEALNNQPLIGRAGRFWQKALIESLGYSRSDVLICNSLRCHPPKNQYPTGKLRKEAEKHCRHWDSSLVQFNPTIFLVTLHPAALLRTPNLTLLVLADLKKAFTLSQTERPCVLMGDKAMSVFAPFLKGGVKRWRGSTWKNSSSSATLGSISNSTGI
jgi:uracil-DNA glycosylase